jgi:hypothetical protein
LDDSIVESAARAFPHEPGDPMESFIHQQKLASYRRLIAESNLAVTKNQVQHRWLLKLFADEEAKDIEPPDRLY